MLGPKFLAAAHAVRPPLATHLGSNVSVALGAGVQMLLALDAALRAPPPPGSGQPGVVDEDWGARSWVASARWKPVLLSVLSQAADEGTARAAIKQVRVRAGAGVWVGWPSGPAIYDREDCYTISSMLLLTCPLHA